MKEIELAWLEALEVGELDDTASDDVEETKDEIDEDDRLLKDTDTWLLKELELKVAVEGLS